ncbi:MAG: hypothetical protein J6Y60_02265 [Treponema sp.]|nr:hypothetical protein [Treponema sp.]
MIQLYPDNFYSDSNTKSEFENAYISKVKVNSQKMKDLIVDCETGLKTLSSLYRGRYFPQTFDELLIISPKYISEIYLYAKNDKSFENEIARLFKPNGNFLLDYDYYSYRIIRFFIDEEKKNKFSINTCVYCNRTYINTFLLENETSKQQYDLDHFIPKGECALFAFSLYNLIPSCQACNSKIKGSNVKYDDLSPEELEKLFPSSKNYDYSSCLKFRLFPTLCKGSYKFPCFRYSEHNNNFKIEFERTKNFTSASMYENKEAESFCIKARYEHHNREFLNHVDKHIKYPASFFMMMTKATKWNPSDLYESLFSSNLRNEEKMIFQKIYNDLDDIFD